MLKPVNGYLLIEPIKYDSFVSSNRETFQEIGLVIGIDDNLENQIGEKNSKGLKVGDRVFFDSWLAGKFPKNEKEYFWLVNWKDIKAIEEKDA